MTDTAATLGMARLLIMVVGISIACVPYFLLRKTSSYPRGAGAWLLATVPVIILTAGCEWYLEQVAKVPPLVATNTVGSGFAIALFFPIVSILPRGAGVT